MKLNIKIKNKIVAATLFLIATTSVETKAQWSDRYTGWAAEPPRMPMNYGERAPFATESMPPLHAPPPGGGDGQKLPVNGGFWILIGLALTHSFIRRKHKRKAVF